MHLIRKYYLTPIIVLLCLGAAVMAFAAVTKVLVHALFPGIVVINVDGKDYTLKEGESTPEGVKLMKANAQEAVLQVNGNYEHRTLDNSKGYHVAPVKEVMVSITPDETGLYYVEGSINAHPVLFMLDTGASHVALNANQATLMGLDYQKDGVMVQAETASGRQQAYAMRIKEIRVGKIVVNNVAALVLTGDLPRNPLLGMSFLSAIEMRNKGTVLELRQY